jgi:hypothetical protein
MLTEELSLQLPVRGHPVHTRSLTLSVSALEGGRWRARGDVIDLRKCSFVPMMDGLQPAGIIHQMTIEAVLDSRSRQLESIETAQPFVAIEASEVSRGECCRDPAWRLQELVGERLDAEFSARLSQVFGGPRGCSHLLTLFHLMATALPKALDLDRALTAELGVARTVGERVFRRSCFVDGCEIDDSTVGVAIQLADFLDKPSAAVESPLDRLALQSDARAYAEVDRQTLALHTLQAAVRERTGKTLASAAWDSADADVRELAGASVIGGLAARLFQLLGNVPERRLLLDCLLQLAPGYIQIMAALMEPWFARGESPSPRAGSASLDIASVGGTPDSCYMWRTGGPMTSLRGGGLSKPRGE